MACFRQHGTSHDRLVEKWALQIWLGYALNPVVQLVTHNVYGEGDINLDDRTRFVHVPDRHELKAANGTTKVDKSRKPATSSKNACSGTSQSHTEDIAALVLRSHQVSVPPGHLTTHAVWIVDVISQ